MTVVDQSSFADIAASDEETFASTLGVARALSRSERSRRTAQALRMAAEAVDNAQRARLLEAVVVMNRRVADAVAAKYRGRGVPDEDLQQAAYEGLVKAVQRFDPACAQDLLTFAVPTIRGEVLRHFRDRAWMVRPPRRIQNLQARVNAAIPTLQASLGREPEMAEIAAHLGIGVQECEEAVAAFGCFHPPSLERRVGPEHGGAMLGELLPDSQDQLPAAEARCVLEPAVRRLSERDRRVLYLRFYEERTQEEIGEELGLRQAQVSRLVGRILADLRAAVDPPASGPPRKASTRAPLGRA